eukprot:TRINITY_DN1700_c0_g1_i8.p1 TRINITY_DN1700_c0_g1~~TRINITY_DN1700_c0_g1_i8.p1  ORF type:complete len:435 (+),score=65.01 TRINITY_DN1700_c0_g1_i8:215-1519(+)
MLSFSIEDVKNLKNWGQNVIRLFVSWEATEAVRGEYNMTYIEVLKQIVEMCAKEDIQVIIDAHQDLLSPYFCGEGFPKWAVHIENFPYPLQVELRRDENGIPLVEDCIKQTFGDYYGTEDMFKSFGNFYANVDGVADSFGKFWRMVASNFKDYPNVIGYDIINEPFLGTPFKNRFTYLKHLLPLYKLLHNYIREVDNSTILFFEGFLQDEINPFVRETPGGLEYNDRQTYSIHLYCPFQNGQGEPSSQPLCSLIDALNFRAKYTAAKRMGTGVFLTEFGAVSASEIGLREIERTLVKTDATFMSWTYWQFKYYQDYTTTCKPAANESFYGSDGNILTEKLKLFTRPYLPEICGTPVSAKYNSKKNYAKLVYRAGQCSDYTSVLYFNKELFNNGNEVSLSVSSNVEIKEIRPNYYSLRHEAQHAGKEILVVLKPQ